MHLTQKGVFNTGGMRIVPLMTKQPHIILSSARVPTALLGLLLLSRL